MKKSLENFVRHQWTGLMHSMLYRVVYALIWMVISLFIITFFDLNSPWWFVAPAPSILYVTYVVIKMIAYAWIINPIKGMIEKRKMIRRNLTYFKTSY